MDIVREHHEQSKSIIGKERAVYDACLAGIAVADEQQTLELLDLRRIREAPTILNLRDHLTYPDEILLRDSEWHAGFFDGELDPALCKPPPEFWPFLEKVGVKKLSESAEVELEFVDGQETIEALLVDKLVERIEILARLLHDKPTTVKLKISKALSELEAVSYDLVRIQAAVNLGGNQVSAPPRSVHAFCDIDNRRLVLARPVGDRSWPHILNAIFHQLMPEESGSEISKLTLSIRPLMSMPVEEAHQELTAAGIPFLEPVNREAPPTSRRQSSMILELRKSQRANKLPHQIRHPLSQWVRICLLVIGRSTTSQMIGRLLPAKQRTTRQPTRLGEVTLNLLSQEGARILQRPVRLVLQRVDKQELVVRIALRTRILRVSAGRSTRNNGIDAFSPMFAKRGKTLLISKKAMALHRNTTWRLRLLPAMLSVHSKRPVVVLQSRCLRHTLVTTSKS